MSNIPLKKKRTMVYFIEAAESILRTEGINGISIRKVANKAGYNSATLYNYFDSIDHLILFASMPYHSDYARDLQKALANVHDIEEEFKTIYQVFSSHAFKSPEIFYNMFFGKHSSDLYDVLQSYFELFPEMIQNHTPEVQKMLTGANMCERDLAIANIMVASGRMNPYKKNLAIEILSRTVESCLREAIDSPYKETLKEKFLALFEYILESSK